MSNNYFKFLRLSEAIERYIPNCKENSAEEGSIWMSDQIEKLQKRLEAKLAIHKPRFHEIKQNVYEIRLAELQIHTERLERHKAVYANFYTERIYSIFSCLK